MCGFIPHVAADSVEFRSEEDWRALFDTLYQQEHEEAKAAAAAAATSCINDTVPVESIEISAGGGSDVPLS